MLESRPWYAPIERWPAIPPKGRHASELRVRTVRFEIVAHVEEPDGGRRCGPIEEVLTGAVLFAADELPGCICAHPVPEVRHPWFCAECGGVVLE